MNNKEIEQEWLSLTGGAFGGPEMASFSLPKDYFNTFPQQLMRRLAKENLLSEPHAELWEIAPEIAHLSRKLPFSLPEGFAASLQQHALLPAEWAKQQGFSSSDRLRVPMPPLFSADGSGQRLASHRKGFWRRRWVQVAMAACVIGLGVVGWWLHQRQQSLTAKLSKIPTEAIAQYLETNTDLFNSDLIWHQLDTTRIVESFSMMNMGGITEQDIQQYLNMDSASDYYLP
ncbi:MAG: hypothetical protein K6T34_06660 [Thermoflavifilum sp.]|nr:hypothetical protein [Thermoflavifilum sp.]